MAADRLLLGNDCKAVVCQQSFSRVSRAFVDNAVGTVYLWAQVHDALQCVAVRRLAVRRNVLLQAHLIPACPLQDLSVGAAGGWPGIQLHPRQPQEEVGQPAE
jgi:hypothetical protein